MGVYGCTIPSKWQGWQPTCFRAKMTMAHVVCAEYSSTSDCKMTKVYDMLVHIYTWSNFYLHINKLACESTMQSLCISKKWNNMEGCVPSSNRMRTWNNFANKNMGIHKLLKFGIEPWKIPLAHPLYIRVGQWVSPALVTIHNPQSTT